MVVESGWQLWAVEVDLENWMRKGRAVQVTYSLAGESSVGAAIEGMSCS